MAQSIHHCPLCQGEISRRKSELLRSAVTQMQAIDAEQLMEKAANTQPLHSPETPLKVKLEPVVDELHQSGPSIPTSHLNPMKKPYRESPVDEEKEQYPCPAPGCCNVYRKLGASLIKHAFEKHGMTINPNEVSRQRKRGRPAFTSDLTTQIKKKFCPNIEAPTNNSVVLHSSLATNHFPWDNDESRVLSDQEIISQTVTREDGTTEIQYKCPWEKCKSVYRRIGQALIRHAFEKHGLVIQQTSQEGLYSCPAVGCMSFYRKYGAALFHHAWEKHGIDLKNWQTNRGLPRKTSVFNINSGKQKTEQKLAAKMIAQVQQVSLSSNNNVKVQNDKRNCQPSGCYSCGLVFPNRSKMLAHLTLAHKNHKKIVQLPELEPMLDEAKFNSEAAGLLNNISELELIQVEEKKQHSRASKLETISREVPSNELESETESDSHPEIEATIEESSTNDNLLLKKSKPTPVVLDLKEKPNAIPISKQNPHYFLLKDSFIQKVEEKGKV